MVTMLSPHFALDEFMVSDYAIRNGIDNTPPKEVIPNLERVADMLEKVRGQLGNLPITITSGYRCRRLNAAIKGADNSFHVFGLAVDFICPKFGSPLEICQALARNPDIKFDQLIHEYGRWVHLGLSFGNLKPRRELLTIDSQGTRLGLQKTR